MNRPITTLFLLTSVDGKISTGNKETWDVDKDFPKIKGIKEGLKQYYALEQMTDLYSLNSGKVLAKVGVNKRQKNLVKSPVSFLVIDNKPHLNKIGVRNLLKKSERLYIVTTNNNHPAFHETLADNLKILFYKKRIDFADLFKKLKSVYGIRSLTVQTGGTLNAILVRSGLIDKISLVVAPALIGGKDTPSLMDGKSLSSPKELSLIKALTLTGVKKLDGSYLHLTYDVIHPTKISKKRPL